MKLHYHGSLPSKFMRAILESLLFISKKLLEFTNSKLHLAPSIGYVRLKKLDFEYLIRHEAKVKSQIE